MDLSYSKQYKKLYKYLKLNKSVTKFSPKFLSYDLDIRIEDIKNIISLLTTYNLVKREYEEGHFVYSVNTDLKEGEEEKIFESIDLALQYINNSNVALKNVIKTKVVLSYDEIVTQLKFELKENPFAYVDLSRTHKNLKPHILKQKLSTEFDDCFIKIYYDEDDEKYNRLVLLRIIPDLIKRGKLPRKIKKYLNLTKLDLVEDDEAEEGKENA